MVNQEELTLALKNIQDQLNDLQKAICDLMDTKTDLIEEAIVDLADNVYNCLS